MFVAEAIADFSTSVIQGQKEQASNPKQEQVKADQEQKQILSQIQKESKEDEQSKQLNQNQNQKQQQQEVQDQEQEQQQKQKEDGSENLEEEGTKKKRKRDQDHQQQLKEQEQKITYIQFKKGDKILVRQTDQSGWWFGNVIGKIHQGYFPSTFVQCGTKAPPPPAPPEPDKKDWMTQQLEKLHQGPVQSEYYQGIIGHKLVKIDDKNKNLLKANYVKFNEATGLASVPIKSQAPNAKAVRQMGYFFDYHQWIDQRNNIPDVKARPDIRRKKQKKLNLKLFGQQANKKKN